MESWLNVRDFGAIGNGVADDTESIQKAVSAARQKDVATRTTIPLHNVVYFPPGEYLVSSEIVVSNGSFYGCRLQGANAEAVRIVPARTMSPNEKIFVFRGGSGRCSNVGIKDMTIGSDANQPSSIRGIGVYIDGQDFGIFENLRFERLKYGIWIHNNSSGTFSELNQFHQIVLNYCQNGIRLERGGGDASFHGNDFNNCYFNVGAKQIGFNHVSGYLYNARFRMFMWAHSIESVYVNANGNATDNIGDITYESFKKGKITGSGRFWFNGFFRGIPSNGVSDETKRSKDWEKVFACTNYWKPSPYASSGMKAGPLDAHNNSFNGPVGFFQSLKKKEVTSVVLNTYNGSPSNGLYLGRSGFQQSEEKAKLGLFLSGSGDRIKSYHRQPLAIENPQGVEFRVGGTRGFKMLAGQAVIKGGGNSYRWQEVLSFKHMMGGRLFLLDREDDPSLTTIIDITWNNGAEDSKLVSEILRKNRDRQEHLKARVRTKSAPTLQIGANVRDDIQLHWYFQGLVL